MLLHREESDLTKNDSLDALDGFGLRLCAARLAAGYKSRKDLADEIETDQNTYSPWERGRSYPSAAELLKLRETLSVTIDWLIADDDRSLSVEVYRRLQASMPMAEDIRSKRLAKRTDRVKATK